MHLIWENLVKNLTLLWTGEFKKLDGGSEEYELGKGVWEAVAASTSAASDTIPSAYGSRIPSIAKDRPNVSAEMWSFWTLYPGPVLLRRRFKRPKYYRHFVQLVRLLNLCMQFEITDEEIETLRTGFIAWVEEYERIYFQYDVSRMGVCPLTIHALLHIAAGIKFCGPVWCYWVFPMERFCGSIQPGIWSRRFPWASIDRYLVESPIRPNTNTIRSIAIALSTRTGSKIGSITKALKDAVIEEWGKVRRIDSEAEDTMRSCSVGILAEDSRDATYVRYEMLVDQIALYRNREEDFQLETFYGQLEHIYRIHLSDAFRALDTDGATTYILAAIRTCVLEPEDRDLSGLDVHFYSRAGALDVIDIITVQSLVGRVKDVSNEWAVIDRSGVLARAEWVGENNT
ncbi:hypothetical protein DFH08DRAFT_910807 [Mycena albidolilacea]|uniref:Uncharacterized protein n=1 Tax=Mycena albidolilacea TaxID=1033008 RepID=A0AAD7AM90_9AGAR|nr:hypothetical protein DFH08DRAFT_910807 [Mycena albidolilacea]